MLEKFSGLIPYIPKVRSETVINLDRNETASLFSRKELQELGSDSAPAFYPAAEELEGLLASKFNLQPENVIVTCGADDSLQRLLSISLDKTKELALTAPTFSMMKHLSQALGCPVKEIPWIADFPLKEFLSLNQEKTGAVAIVTPNNPTGSIATEEELIAVLKQYPKTLVIIDCAYIEFADIDPTDKLLTYSNCVVTRTFSKAWGLAGGRVGYALGRPEVITAMRCMGSPYPCSNFSLTAACRLLKEKQNAQKEQTSFIVKRRNEIEQILSSSGLPISPSQANFVSITGGKAEVIYNKLLEQGIRTRFFQATVHTPEYCRITIPVVNSEHLNLVAGLKSILPGDS